MPSAMIVRSERPPERHDRPRERPFLLAFGGPDEFAGDLEDVDPEAAQVAERRVAGPEVVDGDPDPEIADRLEARDRRRGVVEHDRLGHLEHELPRLEAGLAQDGLDVADEGRLLELLCRQVDRDRQAAIGAGAGRPRPPPAGRPRTGPSARAAGSSRSPRPDGRTRSDRSGRARDAASARALPRPRSAHPAATRSAGSRPTARRGRGSATARR